MAKLSFKINAEWEKVQRLREEISKLKQEIKGTDAFQNPQQFNALNKQLESAYNQLKAIQQKMADEGARIVESANRIDKAVERITQAQNSAVKAAKQSNDTSTTKAQAEAVEGQAKAYVELKDEIDAVLGTREENIRQMLREQNAIRLINAEISQINKSRQSGGGLSRTQSQRLQQLNNDLLTHKRALAEVRQELNNNAKLDITAVGSMNELSQSLSRMRIAYRALNEDERNSKFGQDLLASIQEADAKIKELDATIGNHQRNVGNYQGGFNGLNMSVQQIVRELPSATMGVNMFFMAISNNLPIMADQIKYAKEANKAMKAAGQEPVPIWKQLTASIFSWQTAMMVGITLLTVYGKDIKNWASGLFNAKTAINDLIFAQRQLREASKEAQHEAVSEQTKLKTLYAATQDTTIAMKDRLTAVKAIKEQYPSYFSKLSNEAILAGQAAGAYRQLAADILKAAQARAMEKRIEKLADQNIDLERSNNADKNWRRRNRNAYYKSISSHQATDNSGARAFVPTGVDMSGGKRDGAIEQEWNERESRLKKHTETLNRNNKTIELLTSKVAKIKATQINLENQKDFKPKKVKTRKEGTTKQIDYDKMRREQSDAERNLEISVAQSRIDAMQEGYEKERTQRELNHKKELEDIEKQRRDFLQRKRDEMKLKFEADPKNKGKVFNASSVTLSTADNAKFDEMIANTKTKHANEYKELEVQRLQALYDYLKEYGTIQEQAYAIAKEYEDKITKEKDENRKKILQKEKESALAKTNSNSLAMNIDWGATFGGIGKVLKDIAKDTLKEVEQYMRSAEFKALSPADKKAYVDLRDKLRSEGVGEVTSPFKFSQWGEIEKQTRTYQDSVRRLKEKTEAHANAVEELKVAEKELSLATDETTRSIAQSKVDKAQVEVRNTASEMNDAIADKDDKKANLTDSTGKAVQGLDNFSSALQTMSNGTLKGFADGLANLIKSIGGKGGAGGIIGAIGGKAGGLIGAILQIIDALGDDPAKFIKGLLDRVGKVVETILAELPKLVVDILKGVLNIIVGIFNGIGRLFTGSGNEKSMEDEIKRLSKSNERLAQSIDDLSKSIGKKDNTNEQSIDAYKKALKEELDWERNQRNAINKRASEWGRHHSFNYDANDSSWHIWGKLNKILEKIGSKARVYNATDVWKLSPEEMKELRAQAMDAWREFFDSNKGLKSPEDLVNQYIERAGKQEELSATLNEKLTGYSWDGFMDSYKSALKNLESTTKDFADNINDLISNALIDSFTNEKLKPQIDELYKYIAKAAENGLDDREIAYIRKTNEDIANQGIEQRNIWEQAGLIKKKGDEEQNATANGVSSITFEQANNIVALTTAGNISRDQIKERLSLMNATMDDIRALMSQTFSSMPNYTNSTHNILNDSYTPKIQVSFPKEELQNINGKIGTILAVVDEMRSHGAESLMEQKALSRDTEKIVMGNKEMLSCVNDFRRDFNKQY